MTEFLLTALKSSLESRIAGNPEKGISPLVAEKQGHDTLQPLIVYRNYIPSDVNDSTAYPCLVVRWAEADEGDDFATETVDILVCTYSEKGRRASESWANIVAGRLRSFLRESTLIGENKFHRVGNVRAINPTLNPDEKHFSHHILTIRTQWQYPLPDITSEAI